MHKDERYPYINGTVWQTPMFHTCVLTWLDGDSWCLVGMGRHLAGYPACVMNTYHDEKGKWMYKHAELPERLKGWECKGYWEGQAMPKACMPEEP